MNQRETHALERRVGRLEREVSRWRRLGAAVAICALCALLMGQLVPVEEAPDLIPAPGMAFLPIISDSGITMAYLDADEREVSLTLYGRRSAGGQRNAVDAGDIPRLVARHQANGMTALSVHDESGHARVEVSLPQRGEPSIALRDDSRGERLRLELSDDGAPRLVMRDQRGTGRLSLGLDRTGNPHLTLFDPQGSVASRFAPGTPVERPTLERSAQDRPLIEQTVPRPIQVAPRRP